MHGAASHASTRNCGPPKRSAVFWRDDPWKKVHEQKSSHTSFPQHVFKWTANFSRQFKSSTSILPPKSVVFDHSSPQVARLFHLFSHDPWRPGPQGGVSAEFAIQIKKNQSVFHPNSIQNLSQGHFFMMISKDFIQFSHGSFTTFMAFASEALRQWHLQLRRGPFLHPHRSGHRFLGLHGRQVHGARRTGGVDLEISVLNKKPTFEDVGKILKDWKHIWRLKVGSKMFYALIETYWKMQCFWLKAKWNLEISARTLHLKTCCSTACGRNLTASSCSISCANFSKAAAPGAELWASAGSKVLQGPRQCSAASNWPCVTRSRATSWSLLRSKRPDNGTGWSHGISCKK